MKTNKLRKTFLSFYQDKGHDKRDSAPLIPSGDSTLLFTNAGMNQFKRNFKNAGPLRKVTTCQKCLRTGDIKQVGKTPFHMTFFEMLGNFSFGEYFKEQAIKWAWQLLTEQLNINQNKLIVSVYKEDDEAYSVWKNKIGLSDSYIVKRGESENFWPADSISKGPNGPCGPCSEIHYRYDDGTLSELYNIVFMQYQRTDGGELNELPQKNIDTGMGLERMAAVLQDVKSVFEIDLFRPITKKVGKLLDYKYDKTHSCKNRIADHLRASVMLMIDGIFPSNNGRGYVLKKIIRRAVDSLKQCGADEPILYNIVGTIIDQMKPAYPDLTDIKDIAPKVIRNEEQSYFQTLNKGRRKFKQELENSSKLSGDQAFDLYQTHGLSKYWISKFADEFDVDVNWNKFKERLRQQRRQSRRNSKLENDVFE